MKLNIFKNKNTNIEKLNKKYQSQKYLAKKDFNQLNPNLVTLSLSVNKKRFANYDKPVAGTVIESGFFDWKHVYISNNLFANSVADYPYNKIHKLVNKAKQLTIHQKAKTWFRLSDTKSFICFAGAGSGKTTGIVLPTIVANALSPTQPNLLITDPKGELAKSTFNFLKENDYEVKVINLLDEKNSDCFSPFTLVKEFIWKMLEFPLDVYDLSIDLFNAKSEIINNLDTELKNVIYSLNDKPGVSAEKFWDQKASVAIHNIAWLIIDDLSFQYKKWEDLNVDLTEEEKLAKFHKIFIQFSFQSIYETLAGFGRSGATRYKEFYKNNFNVDIDNLSTNFIKEHKGLQQWKNLWRGEDSKSSFSEDIISNALNILEKFNIPALYNLTTFNTFSLDDLYGDKEKPFALFITINNSEIASLSYVSWFINYLLMKLNSYATKGNKTKLKKPLMCIFEEIGNVPYIQFLPITVNEGRGKNIFASLFFQTFAQYREKYLKDGDFMRSCAYRILLTNSEGYFVKELVDYAGYYQYFDKTNNKSIKENRLTENDIYSLPKYRAIIFQNDINVPYISGLIPFHLFGFKMLDRLNIKNTDPKFKDKNHIVYNPLTTNDQLNSLTVDKANVFDFDFSKQSKYKLTKELKQKLNELLDKMIKYVKRPEDKKYWQIRKETLEKQEIVDEQQTISLNIDLDNSITNQTSNNFIDLEFFQKIMDLSETKLSKFKEAKVYDGEFLEITNLARNVEGKILKIFQMENSKEILAYFSYNKLKKLKLDIQAQLNHSYKFILIKAIEYVDLKSLFKKQFNSHLDLDSFAKIKEAQKHLSWICELFNQKNDDINKNLFNSSNFKKINNVLNFQYIGFLIKYPRFLFLIQWNKSILDHFVKILRSEEKIRFLKLVLSDENIKHLIDLTNN